MPVRIRKLPKRRLYRVRTPHGIKARATTRTKALRQRRLLKGIEHGWIPTGKKARR